MKVGWLLDAEMFQTYRDDLVASIRRLGHEFRLVRAPSPPYRWDDGGNSYRESFADGACVITHADIGLVSQIRHERRWTPGVFATIEHFDCSSYYCRFGEFLLNRDYIMLPFGELRRQREFLFDTVGREGRIFIRPNSPLKLFTGQVVASDSYDADLEYLAFYEFPDHSLVVVSSPQPIEFEWRFVVVNHQVVAGSQYKHQGKNDAQAGFDPDAGKFAAHIASMEYQPDPAWVMDVCRTTDGGYHLLEIGGFSFCDLYQCDKDAVVAAVSKAAWSEWNLKAAV